MKLGGAMAVVLAICCLTFVSCDIGGGGVPTPAQGEPSVIRGQVWFQPSERMFTGALGDSCEVDGQSYDLHAGAPVVVNDVAGSIIASGVLEAGVIVERSLGVPHGCRFAFTIEDVPVSAYYQIEVGSVLASSSLTLSYDELEAENWTVEWEVSE
jgi:hypothetical protein